jgi:hypothetical protein
MYGFLKRAFGRKLAEPEAGEGSRPTSMEAGQVYSFQTRPYTELSPSPTGRFAAIKILGLNDNYVAVAVLDGIWPISPTFAEVRTTSIINEHRFELLPVWWTPR